MEHPSPHDSFFKEIFKNPEAAGDLFRAFLPEGIVAALKWETLKLEPGSYIDESLVASHSDLLFSCDLKGKRAFVYFLFEHQSTVERLMPLRIARYCLSILDEWVKEHASEDLPAVIPVVFYQGGRPWNAPTDLVSLCRLGEEQAALERHLLSVEFILCDLQKLNLEGMRAGLLLRLTLSLMKAVVERKQVDWIDVHRGDLSELVVRSDGRIVIRRMFNYILLTERSGSSSTLKEIANKVVHQEIRKEVMSLAEALQEEGRAEGKREAMISQIRFLEGALRRPVRDSSALRQVSLQELDREVELLQKELQARLPQD